MGRFFQLLLLALLSLVSCEQDSSKTESAVSSSDASQQSFALADQYAVPDAILQAVDREVLPGTPGDRMGALRKLYEEGESSIRVQDSHLPMMRK